MDFALIPPSSTTLLFVPAVAVYVLIPLVGIAIFAYMIFVRVKPLLCAAPDDRSNNLSMRLMQLLKIWLLQWRHPRYMLAGVLHILLFAGFLLLGLRSLELIFVGIIPGFHLPGMDGAIGQLYGIIRTYAATWVLVVALIAIVRRGIVQPERYAVPEKYGKAHTGEAVFVLCMISTLVISESLFEGSLVSAQLQKGMHAEYLAPLTLAWGFKHLLATASESPSGHGFRIHPAGPSFGIVSDSRDHLFYLFMLSAVGQAFPRGDLFVQCHVHAAQTRQCEAGAPRGVR
jgi:hypothetical protein